MKKLLEAIKQSWQYIAAIGGIAGATLWFDAKFDSSVDNQEAVMDSITAVREMVTYINVEQSFMAADILDIKDTMERLENKIDDNSSAIFTTNSLMRYERQHRSEYTKEQLDQQLLEFERLLKKNGEIALSPIVSNTETLLSGRGEKE